MNTRLVKIIRKQNSRTSTKSKEFTCQFWEPGIVSYEDSGLGKALLRKEVMDAIAPDFVGKPVIIEHQDGTPDELFKNGTAVGKITAVRWNGETGWYDCDFTAETDEAADKIENEGWSVSCAFDSNDNGAGGQYHAIDYQFEIMGGNAIHLALVPNPRYEDSKIFTNSGVMLINSKKATTMKENAPDTRFVKGDSVLVSIGEEGQQKEGTIVEFNQAHNAWVVKFSDGSTKEIGSPRIRSNSKQNEKRKCSRCGRVFMSTTNPPGNCPDCSSSDSVKQNETVPLEKAPPADDSETVPLANADPKITKLAEDILEHYPTPNESQCVSYALEKGFKKYDGQLAWIEIHREMRAMNAKENATNPENDKHRVKIKLTSQNSKEKKAMLGIFKLFGKKENAADKSVEGTVDHKNSYVMINVKKENEMVEAIKVPIDELLNAQDETEKEEAEAKKNGGTEELPIANSDEEIMVNGKSHKIGDLMANWSKRQASKSKKNETEEEKKAREDEEKKNAKDAEEKKEKDLTIEKQNSAPARDIKYFQNLNGKHAAAKENQVQTGSAFETMAEKTLRGKQRYGSKK